MTTTNTSRPHAPQLVRPRSGRWISGVAIGLAQRLDLPVWLVRIALVAMIGAGGAGLLAYAAGAVLIPDEGRSETTATRWLANLNGGRAWAGIALLGVAALITADNTGVIAPDLIVAGILFVVGVLLYRGDLSIDREEQPVGEETMDTRTEPLGMVDTEAGTGSVPPPPPPIPTTNPPPPPPPPPVPPKPRPPRERSILGRLTIGVLFLTLAGLAIADLASDQVDANFRHYVAVGLTVIGLGLVVGAVLGRARWLIVVGIFATPVVLASPAGEYDFNAISDNNVTHRPTSVDEIAASYFEEEGTLTVDLTNVELDGATVELEARVNLGEVIVIVPDDAAVQATGSVDAGLVEVFSRSSAGLGTIRASDSVGGDNGTILVDVSADLGRAAVEREGIASVASFARDSVTVVDSFDALLPRYETGFGDVVVDLSGVTLSDLDDDGQETRIEVGTGTARVILPREVETDVEASVGIGSILMPDGAEDGIDISEDYSNAPGSDPELTIVIEVGAGDIIVEES